MQLRTILPRNLNADRPCPVWAHYPDQSTKDMKTFCSEHLDRRITFTDLRASFVTQCQELGMSPTQESRIVGHSIEVAERYYSEYDARNAITKLPADPLTSRRKGVV